MELLIEHVTRGLMLSLLLSLPLVLVAAGIGLVVGILQAVTQVQEQTIAAAPKILGVFAALLLGSNFMMDLLQDYVRESFQVAFVDVPQNGVFVLPPAPRGASRKARAARFFGDRNPGETFQDRIKALRGEGGGGGQSLDSKGGAPAWTPPSRTDEKLNQAEKMLINRQKQGQ